MNYRRVLAAIDISEEGRQVVEAAAAVAAAFDAELHIMHVVEPASVAYGPVMHADLHTLETGQMRRHAETRLAELASEFDGDGGNVHVLTGRTISEIHTAAEAESADLVVVGSHGRHGLGLLLGSTANGVLHGAKRDVLAVRVRPPVTDQ